jgi:Holliday junction resolvase
MLESTLKTKAKKELEKAGWLVIHLIQTNLNGIPDTMILKDGRAVFIEFKQAGKEARELQEYRIKQLIDNGFEALVIDDMEGVKKLI